MKLTLLTLVLLTFALSCSTDDETKVQSNSDNVKTSIAFRSLNVSASDLDLDNVQTETTPAGLKVLIVSFKNDESKKVFNFLNDENQITLSTLAKVESSINAKDYFDKFDQKQFEGKISFLNSSGEYFGMDFKESKIVNYFVATSMIKQSHDIASRTEECSGWTEKGGPLDCAGASVESEGFFSKAACYSEFMICLGLKVMDCIKSGCLMQPVPTGFITLNGVTTPIYPIASSVKLPPELIVTQPTFTRTTNISPTRFILPQ
jgi:hypothetical protein